MAIKTKAHPRKADGMGARSVVVTAKNAVNVRLWLRTKQDGIAWKRGKNADEAIPTIRVRTPKGIRLAAVGDTIVKYGTWYKDFEPYFEVIKA